ncbi:MULTISPECIES: SCO family protein [unclassified Duganella]|uniref:SCO family protein n=1 Tax=unclassified Duganella TaxID=2636909 RepID=UPI0007019997|nr:MULTISPECIES: SCO family protein [unclassified Duganella]KQV51097.1 photosynthetic protein synthase I [Duganella sp. Root336D2]KRC00678.1 photosynthetic protein synthase I [Duganella sp. Root198D2]
MKKLFAALFMLLALVACGEKQLKFENTDLTGLDYGKGFSLNDHTGKPVTLESYKGKVVVLFFGFTHCPDVCPTTMAEMSAVMKELGPDADKVQVLFATLDPERDTKELLSQYVPGFDSRFVGLYGTPQQVADTAKEFKVFYQKVPGKTPGSYTIDHTAGSYVFDKGGKLRLFLRHGGGPAPIVHDLKLLLD